MTLVEKKKIEISDKLKSGETVASFAGKCEMKESSAREIRKNEDIIRRSVMEKVPIETGPLTERTSKCKRGIQKLLESYEEVKFENTQTTKGYKHLSPSVFDLPNMYVCVGN